jgi:hypothetical protein
MRVCRKQSTLALLALLALSGSVAGQQAETAQAPPQWSDAEKEKFLLTAKVIRTRGVSTGITGTQRATLSDGKQTHDASIQTVDISKPTFQTATGTELNFRDSYKYNIAAYRLDRLLALNMIPVSVQRTVKGTTGAVTWWVDNVKMMEKDRFQKKIDAPDPDDWNDQMYQVRVFNELVYNTDANLGNLLITEDWQLRMIDFSRAFRLYKELRDPKNLINCRLDRRLYDGLRVLNEESLTQRLRDVLRANEISGVLARRDRILAYFDEQISHRGAQSVICDKSGH